MEIGKSKLAGKKKEKSHKTVLASRSKKLGKKEETFYFVKTQ